MRRSLKKKCSEFKEKQRVEEKERLVERLCIFDFISILSKESDNFQYSKGKESEFEKNESIKEDECYIEKQESIEKEQKEKCVVALDKSEVVSAFTNPTNSIVVSDSSYVQKFFTQNLENEGSFDYNIYRTISFFDPTYHSLKEIELYLFAIIFDSISLEPPCTWTSMLGRNHIKNSEDQEEIVEKELFQCHEDSSINPSLNPFLLSHEVSYEELKWFRASYVTHVSIIGDACSISFGGGLFLVVPYVSKYLSSHTSFEESLMHSGVKFDPSCYYFVYASFSQVLDFISKVHFEYHHLYKEVIFQTFDLLNLSLNFRTNVTFYYQLPFKDVDICHLFERMSKRLFLRSYI
ncbi:hypothetical protein M9H77_30060 [Catharanthus roseus]|uniref:Uncharacterized protein n=1 Tax=Catharanthus roseus TaxID=4058 RepID=A0ACB9ZW71_CATRO|nr:hypothetical protein M9H77_30060 [Catharanthus roseus]